MNGKRQLITFFIAIVFSQLSFAGDVSPFLVTSKEPHQMQILDSGMAAFEIRLQMIERAQESIEVEYFIYDTDPSTRLFTQALVRKAKEGVKVRILLDTFMTKPEIDQFFIHELKKHGVEVKYYNTAPMIRFIKFMYRNHRKLMSVDGREAIVGGRNIADEYFDLRTDFNFIDKDVYVEGPVVEQIVKSFDAYWDHKLSKQPKPPKKPKKSAFKYRRYGRSLIDPYHRYNPGDRFLRRNIRAFQKDLKKYDEKANDAIDFITENDEDRALLTEMRDLGKAVLENEPKTICHETVFASDEPGWGRKSRKNKHLAKYILAEMKKVEKKLVIDSPYFIVDKPHRKVLKKLLKDKKEVEVFTNSLYSTDAIYVNAVFNATIGKWLKRGIKTSIYRGQLVDNYPTLTEEISKSRWGTHTKTFVFDDKDVLIGTYNLDPRSHRFNNEMAVICKNTPEFVEAMELSLENKKLKSYPIKTKKDLRKVKFEGISFGKAVLYYILKPISLLLDHLL